MTQEPNRHNQTDGTVSEGSLAARLTRSRLATRAVMTLERAWPLLLPLLVVASLFVSVSWFGLFRIAPDWLRLVFVGLLALLGVAALWPLRAYRQPGAAEVDRRIEAANALVHTPIQVQTDHPSGQQDAFSQALWREHQRRMAARLGRLGSDLPRTGVPQRDPWGLRAAAALLLIIGFAFSFGPLGGRVADGFRAAALPEVLPARIDAWVTPPAYTGKAPVFLTADATRPMGVVTVPEGSEVALRVTGGSGSEMLFYEGADGASEIPAQGAKPSDAAKGEAPAAPVQAAPAAGAPRQFAGKLTTDGVLSLRSNGRDLQSWSFSVIPDKAPVIRFAAEPKRAANGALELAYEIEDDYGAASAQSTFELEQAPPAGARPLYGPPEMPLSLPRKGNGVAAKANRDLTEHVWAGSTVKLTLKATDGAGQEGFSEPKSFVLPERGFTNPLARAVVEFRKLISLDTRAKPKVLGLIDAITLRPEDTFDNPSHYLGIMAGQTRLRLAATDDQLRDVADYFWQMALTIEDGGLSDAEKRLKQAQEALKQALENGASDEEIDKLMAELREAMNDFLREFAERAQRDPNMAQQQPQPGQELRQSDLQKMLDQIENLAKSGNRDQAQQLLSELEQMMNNLQAGRPQQGQGEQNSEMREQMDKLGEIMRRQQQMMNETFRMDQMQRGEQQRGEPGEEGEQGEQGEGQQGQGEQGRPMTPEEFAEALKQLQEGQGQLQQELGQLQEGLKGMGIEPGEGFGEAGEAMGEAEGALGEGEGDRAVGQQGRALEALRRGAQDMMQQMQQAMQGDQGGGQEGGRQQNSDRDPLGRPRATNGPDFGNSVEVPDEIDVQRARQILDAIRKRLGNALSPQLERDYLERLLELR